MKHVFAVVLVLALVGWLGFVVFSKPADAPTNSDVSTSTDAAPSATTTPAQTEQYAAPTNVTTSMQATITTNKGVIVLELYGDKTPNTVANFTKLAQDGFYNSTKFHRVIEGFMIQGGDPLTKDDGQQAMWGTGGPGYKFADEIVPGLSNVTGTISMANAGPNTNGSQFFINVADNTFLDGKHAVFGRVISGMDVVMAISQAERNQRDVPTSPIVLESVVVNDVEAR